MIRKSVVQFVMAMALILVIASFSRAGEAPLEEQENVILATILQQGHENHGFIVVDPMTTHVGPHGGSDPSRIKGRLAKESGLEGYDPSPLVDRLFDRNKTPQHLKLESHPEKGYLIDYRGRFARYFEGKGGGWDAWHRDHPEAHGHVRVTLPAYDEKEGIVLIYMDTQSDRLAGAGALYVYKYENGYLRQLARITLRIS
jgi:hypothetical protein